MDRSLNIAQPLPFSSSVMDFACKELESYLNRIFPSAVLSAKQFIFKCTPESLRFDGYRITSSGGRIEFLASCERGFLHGVYALLHELGCSFVFPGKSREVIPQLTDWPLREDFMLLQEPWLEYRGLCFYNTTQKTLSKTFDAIDWMAKNGFNFLLTSIHRLDDTGCGDHAILWDEIGYFLLPELEKRGIVIDLSEHSTDFFFPKEKLFEEHPEWFASIKGRRVPGQICYSHAKAVEAYANSIVEFAKNNRWVQFMGIWPLDGGCFCECEKCRDPQTLFEAHRTIAGKLKEARPDLTVEYLAYTPESFVRPQQPMPNNMSVLVCRTRDHIAYEWARCARHAQGAFYFEYMTGDHYRYRSDVILNPRHSHETVNALISYGYRGAVSLYLPLDCWFIPSLNYWYLSRLYYNPTLGIPQLHRELSAQLFGVQFIEQGAAILQKISDELFDPSLWSGAAHGNEWFREHISHRCQELDRILGRQIDAICDQLMNCLRQLSCDVEKKYLKNIENLIDFVNLQQLYYHCVDQYDADHDTFDRAEPYFEELNRLSQKDDPPFISEHYARWRIVGRDNIFIPEQDNLFEARI